MMIIPLYNNSDVFAMYDQAIYVAQTHYNIVYPNHLVSI